jgi:hypothetical protein
MFTSNAEVVRPGTKSSCTSLFPFTAKNPNTALRVGTLECLLAGVRVPGINDLGATYPEFWLRFWGSGYQVAFEWPRGARAKQQQHKQTKAHN